MRHHSSTKEFFSAAAEPAVLPVEIAVVAALMTLGVLFAPVNSNTSVALNETLLFGFLRLCPVHRGKSLALPLRTPSNLGAFAHATAL